MYGFVTHVNVGVVACAGSHSDRQRELASQSAWFVSTEQSSAQRLVSVFQTHMLLAPHAACVYVLLHARMHRDDALFHMQLLSELQAAVAVAATSQRCWHDLVPVFHEQTELAAVQSVSVLRAAH